MMRTIPLVIAAIAIVALTFVEGSMTDRWVDVNVPSEYCASLLDGVPDKIGEWEGVDKEVDDLIQKTAGAQGYVSRIYKNTTTGQEVDVWLIVGHARDTAVHTPDGCYTGNGFEQKEPQAVFPIEAPEQPTGEFWTAVFKQESAYGLVANRVFWAWFKPTLGKESGGEQGGDVVEWIAPDNARFYFGSTRALYKLYFTARIKDPEQKPEDSVCLDFAAEFLPVVNDILAKANNGVPDDFVPPTHDEEAA